MLGALENEVADVKSKNSVQRNRIIHLFLFWNTCRVRRKPGMKQLEKEIAEANKQSMMKRYQLHGTAQSWQTNQRRIPGRERESNGI